MHEPKLYLEIISNENSRVDNPEKQTYAQVKDFITSLLFMEEKKVLLLLNTRHLVMIKHGFVSISTIILASQKILGHASSPSICPWIYEIYAS
jgi:hypothetical protein